MQGASLPAVEACGRTLEGEPVIGGGECGQKETSEGDLFHKRGQEDGERHEEPGGVLEVRTPSKASDLGVGRN